MALIKNITHLGFSIDAYHNIAQYEVYPQSIDGVKTYHVNVTIQTWKDGTKDINLYGRTYKLICSFEELTIDNFYLKIKELPEYQNAIDC